MPGHSQTDTQQAAAGPACSQVCCPQWRAALLPDGDPSSHVLNYIISRTGCMPQHAGGRGRRQEQEGSGNKAPLTPSQVREHEAQLSCLRWDSVTCGPHPAWRRRAL